MKKALLILLVLALVAVIAWQLIQVEEGGFKIDFIVDGQVYASANTNGGGIVDIPENPVKEGFVFDGWYLDDGIWDMPFVESSFIDIELTHNVCVYAKWASGELAEYRVEYYLQNLEKNGYDEPIVLNLTGEIGAEVVADRVFEHFTQDNTAGTLKGNIRDDGSLVLKAYYTRNTYSVSLSNGLAGSISGEGVYPYNTRVTVSADSTNIGYGFAGWYSGDELLSAESEYSFNIDRNIEARFKVVEPLELLEFTSDGSGVTVTGIKDKTVTEIVIPDYVTAIGAEAFAECTNLTSVTIGEGIKSIGSSAFWKCYKLVEVINKSTLNVTAGAWDNGYVAYYAKEVHKGESKIVNQNGYLFITSGGVNYLFGYTGRDTRLTLPASYNGQNYEIYDYAFAYCDGLVSVAIPDGARSIGNSAFYSCTSLKSVSIGNGVGSIGKYAFYSCASLENVTVGSGVTSIETYCFHYCASLVSINYMGSEAQWNSITKGYGWNHNIGAYTITYN